MTYINRRSTHIRASKELDEVIRSIADTKGLSRRQASDFIAIQMKKMLKNHKLEELDYEFKFW